jgi:glycine/D-amino acid oxidase-like deaminating enzyme
MNISLLGVEELRKREPLVGENFHFGIELEDQALLDPPQFVEYLVSNLQKMVFLLSKIVQFRRLNEALENCE